MIEAKEGGRVWVSVELNPLNVPVEEGDEVEEDAERFESVRGSQRVESTLDSDRESPSRSRVG